MGELISRQVLDLWDRYKPTIAVDAIEYDRELRQLLGTNLADVGTDRAVKGFPIDADDLMLRVEKKYGFRSRDRLYDIIRKMPKYELAPAQPKTNYSESPNTSDCISRQAAIDEGMSYINGDCFCDKEDFAKYIEFIEQLPPIQPDIVKCKNCKHYWMHKCMDSMPIERCDLEQTFYDAEIDFCSLAERREVTT